MSFRRLVLIRICLGHFFLVYFELFCFTLILFLNLFVPHFGFYYFVGSRPPFAARLAWPPRPFFAKRSRMAVEFVSKVIV